MLDGDEALAWHAPRGPLHPPYQWCRRPLRARAPEQPSGTPSRGISTHGRFEPWEAVGEQPMGERSLGAATMLGGDEAWAWRAPRGLLRPAYQWRCLSLRARAPEQPSGTPSRGISFEPCGRRWESNRWGNAHSGPLNVHALECSCWQCEEHTGSKDVGNPTNVAMRYCVPAPLYSARSNVYVAVELPQVVQRILRMGAFDGSTREAKGGVGKSWCRQSVSSRNR